MWSLFHAPTLPASGHMASSLSLIEMQGNGQRWGEKRARGSSGVLRDMCLLESSVWDGNVLVEINRTAREAKGAMTCPPYRAERQLSFTFQSK